MIVFDQFSLTFFDATQDQKKVLKNLSFAIQPGDFVSLVGPSGSGKSTLLKVLAGLAVGDFEGRLSLPNWKAAFVFQDAELLPWRSVYENVSLSLDLTGTGHPEEALKLVGLWPARDLFPHQLSGGMAMRTALARALSSGCELLLMDEPFSALDEPLRMKLAEELKQIHSLRRLTSFLVTHSIEEACYLGNVVISLSSQGTLARFHRQDQPVLRHSQQHLELMRSQWYF